MAQAHALDAREAGVPIVLSRHEQTAQVMAAMDRLANATDDAGDRKVQ